MEWLEQATQLCLVLGFCGGVFNYIVIKPLNASIQRLGDIIAELRDDLKHNNERINQLEGEVQSLSKAVLKAHSRIDTFLHEGGETHDFVGHG